MRLYLISGSVLLLCLFFMASSPNVLAVPVSPVSPIASPTPHTIPNEGTPTAVTISDIGMKPEQNGLLVIGWCLATMGTYLGMLQVYYRRIGVPKLIVLFLVCIVFWPFIIANEIIVSNDR